MATHPLYVSTTANDDNGGIFMAQFDSTTGTVHQESLAAQQNGASFLAASPDGFLYAIHDNIGRDGEKASGLCAYQIDPQSGALKLLNTVITEGALCHISLDKTGKWLLGAAYSQGTFSIWPILSDGKIGTLHHTTQHEGSSKDERRQNAPHPHHIVTSPDNTQIFVTDLGMDKVMIYDFDAESGAITDKGEFAALEPGAGPRHIAFHSSGAAFFAVNELDNTVTVFRREDDRFVAVQSISTLPREHTDPTWTAEILLSPNEKTLYATNRGHHSIAVFQIGADFTLKLLEIVATGRFPQHIAFSPCHKWLLSADRDESAVTIFHIDPLHGALTQARTLMNLPAGPMCLSFSVVK